MFIYKITNTINGKIYIGQSIRPIQKRFKRHINDAINNNINTHFAKAIRKYGKDNFVIEEIDTANSQDELNRKEQYWIKYYDSTNKGYNETDSIYKCGGNTYKNKTDEEMQKIKEKIKISKLSNNNPNSKKIKCLNTKTNDELIFNTVKDCQNYFQEKSYRFITTRATNKTRSLYKGIWNIAYIENEYACVENVNKGGIRILVEDLNTNNKQVFESIN